MDLFTLCHRRGVEDPADHSVKKWLPWLYISWPSWLQEILLDVALVPDSVLLLFKYHGWERERTSWSEKRIITRLAYFAGAVCPVYRTTRAFSLPKDRLPTLSQSNLIYLYECRNCGKRYVGRTEQRLADPMINTFRSTLLRSRNPGRKHVVDHQRRKATQRRDTTLRLPVIWLQTRHAVGATRLVTFRADEGEDEESPERFRGCVY